MYVAVGLETFTTLTSATNNVTVGSRAYMVLNQAVGMWCLVQTQVLDVKKHLPGVWHLNAWTNYVDRSVAFGSGATITVYNQLVVATTPKKNNVSSPSSFWKGVMIVPGYTAA